MTDTICRCPVWMEKDLAHWSRLLSWVTSLILRVALTAFFCVLSICQERCHPSNCKDRSCRQGEAGGHSWLGPGGGGVLPGFWRSMVLSWLVRPPEEESPLDVPSWPKWGSKDSSGCGAAAYLQGGERKQVQREGWCVKNHLILRLALWCVFNTGQASSGGEAR